MDRILMQSFLCVFVVLLFNSLMTSANSIKSSKGFTLTTSLLFILVSIGLLIIYLLDYRNIPILIYSSGALLNTIVIIFNGGRMPVDINAVKSALFLSDNEARIQIEEICRKTRGHRIMTETTRFKILGDRFGSSVYSIGDALVTCGSYLIPLQIILVCLFFLLKYFFKY